MAYVTAVVSDLAGLLAFIRNACTANGWTLSADVLWKGNTYVEIKADGVIGISIKGGTGKDGSNLLTGGGPNYAYLGAVAAQAFTFPMTVEAHINATPDEVYVVCNFSTSYYESLAFGISDVPGLTGSGVWYYATRYELQGSDQYKTSAGGFYNGASFGAHPDGGPMFACYAGEGGSVDNGVTNSFIHADLDGQGWAATAGAASFPSSNRFLSPLLASLPNAWNGESVLLPFAVYGARSSGSKYSLVADLKHIRHCRIDYLDPGEIITLGSDSWKVYPWFRKNAATPGGGAGLTHSGTLAFAVRYTGP